MPMRCAWGAVRLRLLRVSGGGMSYTGATELGIGSAGGRASSCRRRRAGGRGQGGDGAAGRQGRGEDAGGDERRLVGGEGAARGQDRQRVVWTGRGDWVETGCSGSEGRTGGSEAKVLLDLTWKGGTGPCGDGVCVEQASPATERRWRIESRRRRARRSTWVSWWVPPLCVCLRRLGVRAVWCAIFYLSIYLSNPPGPMFRA